ncbi:GDP-mannose 4,6-dehydratase [Polynucleobacter sp. MWH-UH23A]|uniref:GDP-mannose 4,6-dehydratase n=1 Tax=Polynucleobacter sp. MWH-UH23A TaxID=1855613 RepID=UPI003364C623
MTKILVIGSNSFSGASYCQFALSKGAWVTGISRSEEPVNALLPYKWGDHHQFDFHRLDLNHDLPLIVGLINSVKPDYVVNFAAQSMVAESWLNPEHWYMTNVVSSIKLHNELRKMNFLKRYVHISTPEVYGNCSGFVKEDYPFNPSTPYAASRAAADLSLRTFFQGYQFPVVTTRAANVYGPGQQLYRIIPRTILFMLMNKKIQLHGGGLSTRSFIHIRDVSDATWRIMVNGINGSVYHISTNEVISIRSLVEKICQKLDRNFGDCVEVVGERLGKDSAYHLDSTKLREELDWQDQVTLDQGIDESIMWVRKYFDVLALQEHDYIHKP